MSKNNFVDYSRYVKKKYSQIDLMEVSTDRAHLAVMFLLKNSFVWMSLYNEIEVRKVMECIKTLRLKVNVKINNYPDNVMIADNDKGRIEFSLANFEDDRVDGFFAPLPKKEEQKQK